MSPNLELARELLKDPRYPRTATYDPEWQVELDMGCPTFWLLESQCSVMDLKLGMRVLDLGCGKAGGSIFLAGCRSAYFSIRNSAKYGCGLGC